MKQTLYEFSYLYRKDTTLKFHFMKKISHTLRAGLLGACLLTGSVFFHTPVISQAAQGDSEAVNALIDQIPSDWPSAPQISSSAAIVMDADSGTVLYAKNATEQHYPASTTKLMTALLTVENDNLGDMVTFSARAVNDLPAGSSHIAMQVGEEMSVRDCLYGLLLPSANEVANALAEHTSGSISAFADLMNARAAELGAVNTHFVNPTGLHDDTHYSCAYDLALIMKECLKNSDFRTIDSAGTYTLPVTNKHSETRTIGSTHSMLRTNNVYYDSRVKGGKTGWTQESGRNLVTYASSQGIHLIIVTLGAEAPQQYEDTRSLMDYAFSSFTVCTPAKEDTTYGETDSSNLLQLPRGNLLLFSLDESATMLLPNGVSFSDLERETTATDDGTIQVTYSWHGYPLAQLPLVRADLSTSDEDAFPVSNTQLGHLHNFHVWYFLLGAAAILLIALIATQLYYLLNPQARVQKKQRQLKKRVARQKRRERGKLKF